MPEFNKRCDPDKHKRRMINGTAFFIAGTSIAFVALLLPEMAVGVSIWLRALFGLMSMATAVTLVYLVTKLLQSLPARFTSVFIGFWILLAWCVYDVLSTFAIMPFSTSWHMTIAASLVISLAAVIVTTIIGAAIMARPIITGVIVIVIISLSAAALSLIKPPLHKTTTNIVALLKTSSQLKVPNPATAGILKVKMLAYGSGRDKHRPEYGAKADLITESVDGSPFMPEGWSIARTAYWGFDQTQLPINGRVWFPEGAGPFPLVLIAHGTTLMTEFSEAGFSYLGELLASRGYIVASVDENFLNYGWHRYGDFKESDIDVRGWLMLKHLQVWKSWNSDTSSPLYGKVDMDRIAFIGHSRGGEAIAAATAFNRMNRYSRNGNIAFDFHFHIRSLIAFAPSDIYQQPYERTTPATITDVNYLLLLGTHDRQVPGILGSRVYQRVSLSDDLNGARRTSINGQNKKESYFKSALYISRANHSQFNSDWGIYDFRWPYRLLSDIGAQLSGEEQRYITKLYVAAFLDATLRGNTRYIPLFRDYRLIENWLPKTAYLNRYQDSSFKTVADFDEDIDPETTTVAGGMIIGKDLEYWHEQDIDYHYFLPLGSRSNRVVSISWQATKDETPMMGFRLPAKEAETWKLKPGNQLMFSILCPGQEACPDISIQLSDAKGRSSRILLNSIISLQPPLHYTLTKLSWLEQPTLVPVLRTISVPFSHFTKLQPKLDLARLQEIDFSFNHNKSGTVMLDDIGFD
jgi:hypothetical protein